MCTADDSSSSLHASWLEDVALLPDDELLALAYTFSHSAARLRVYLELFRARMGERAQFAACLICFDLAQKGDPQMASQFAFLQGTLVSLSRNKEWVQQLVGDQGYLYALWTQCSQSLTHVSEPLAHDAPGVAESYGILRPTDAPVVGHLQLLGDDDLDAETLEVDEQAMWSSYVQACEQFFGSGARVTTYDGSMGFRLRGHHGQARAQAFDVALEHCQKFVAPARGMRPLLLLAWGLSLKARGLLGQPNKRRQHLITQGLTAFVLAAKDVAQVAQVLGPLYADADVWPGIAELLAQYNRFVRTQYRASDREVQGATSHKMIAANHAAWVEAFVAEGMAQ